VLRFQRNTPTNNNTNGINANSPSKNLLYSNVSILSKLKSKNSKSKTMQGVRLK